MSFSGDCIIIREDFSFDRVENLRLGDCILGPDGKDTIITKINPIYKNDNYLLKSRNFYPFYIGSDTEILIRKQFELFNTQSNKYETYLKDKEFVNIGNIFPTNFICLPKIVLPENNSFNNPSLYGLILTKAELIKNKDKSNLVLKNFDKNIKKLQKLDNTLDISQSMKNIYINNFNYSWKENLNCKNYRRKIVNDLFLSKKEDIEIFLKVFFKNNTKMYVNEKEFRCYIDSKILDIQLFYLLSSIYDELPIVESIEKDKVEYKKINQSFKKKRYSITLIQDDKIELNEDNEFLQEIDKINSIKKDIRMYYIETLNNEPFYLNNLIVRR